LEASADSSQQVFVSVASQTMCYFGGIVPLEDSSSLTVGPVLTTASTFAPRLSTPLGKLGSFSRPFRCGQLAKRVGRHQLLTQYGAFQLVSFTSVDQGTNSAVVDIIFHTVLPMKEEAAILPSR
jgi:hypothetical protein